MINHKFTDEEVIKALECCTCGTGDACKNCAIYPFSLDMTVEECMECLMKHALALITRQKAEVERLQVELDDLKRDTVPKLQWSLQRANDMGRDLEVELEAMRCAANSYKVHYENAKAEAIKEYLAKVLEKKDIAGHFSPGHAVVSVSVLECFAKEFTEGKNDV